MDTRMIPPKMTAMPAVCMGVRRSPSAKDAAVIMRNVAAIMMGYAVERGSDLSAKRYATRLPANMNAAPATRILAGDSDRLEKLNPLSAATLSMTFAAAFMRNARVKKIYGIAPE